MVANNQSYDREAAVKFTMEPEKKMSCNGGISFADPRDEYSEETPAPLYFDKGFLLTPMPVQKDEVLFGMEQKPDGCLVCVDKEAIER